MSSHKGKLLAHWTQTWSSPDLHTEVEVRVVRNPAVPTIFTFIDSSPANSHSGATVAGLGVAPKSFSRAEPQNRDYPYISYDENLHFAPTISCKAITSSSHR